MSEIKQASVPSTYEECKTPAQRMRWMLCRTKEHIKRQLAMLTSSHMGPELRAFRKKKLVMVNTSIKKMLASTDEQIVSIASEEEIEEMFKSFGPEIDHLCKNPNQIQPYQAVPSKNRPKSKPKPKP